MKLRLTILIGIVMLTAASANAEVFELKNGDKITGTVIEEGGDTITIKTKAMGEVTIKTSFIKEDEPPAPVVEEKSEWDRKLTAGYLFTDGNSEDQQGNVEVVFDRKNDDGQTTIKWSGLISTEDNTLDERKYAALARYAYNFGDDNKWFHSMQVGGDQDFKGNVEYRITPATGIGYWFMDDEEDKLMAELSAGYEVTEYFDGSESESEMVLIPRGYYETKWGKMTFSQDLTLYPSLEDTDKYRFKSETALKNPISEKISLVLKIVDKFDSEPKGDTDKNDFTFTSGLEVSF